MKKYKIFRPLFLVVIIFLCSMHAILAQQKHSLGTEIWIEPGQSEQDIDNWCRITAESGMKDVRIFMMWTHVEPQPNVWDFEVYDYVYRACEKYNLKLQVTLNPNQPAWHYGREFWGSIHKHAIFSDDSIKEFSKRYIQKVVERYKDSPAQDNWWLMNEPMPSSGETQYKLSGFREEMKSKYGEIEKLNKEWNSSFRSFDEISNVSSIYGAQWAAGQSYYDWTRYCNKHLTDFQRWVADCVKELDTSHPFHTNPGASLSMFQRQEGADWMPFLDSFGLSIHPTWHFGIFTPAQYSMAVAATCEYGRALVGEDKSFWVSELSAGNNMFYNCPTTDDLAGWTWNGVAQGAEKVIYWLLNPRAKGEESGEWAMLNFKNEPSKRLETVSDIAKILNEDSRIDGMKPYESNISILLSIETTLAYDRKSRGPLHLQGSMACYQALAERGIPSKIVQTNLFDWSGARNQVAIVSNMYVFTNEVVAKIREFVENGNKLIVLGASGFYDEKEVCTYIDFKLGDIFGADPTELFTYSDRFKIETVDQKYKFDVSKIAGLLEPRAGAEVISTWKEGVVGVRNQIAKGGEVVWMAANVDLGAWRFSNSALSDFLTDEVSAYTSKLPFRFVSQTDHVVMQTMRGEKKSYITVITNGQSRDEKVSLVNNTKTKPTILFSTNKARKASDILGEMTLEGKECLVLYWK